MRYPSSALALVPFVKQALLAAAVATVVASGAAPARANLIQNPGFETGSYSGWTLGGDTRYDFITSNPAFVHTGTYAARFAGLGDEALLSQTVATTPGGYYLVSFWLMSDGQQPNDFTATFAGRTLLQEDTVVATPYIQYTYTVQATATSSTLQFAARDDPGYWYLDDVSVDPTSSAAPEPSSTLLLGVGAVGLTLYAGARRWRQRAVAPA
ncbi:MAG TPA: carbohydrate binding domain-containing protein [Gemmataceae bacterium]|nr:carbohydrate binding domain-containing protein [Gemmataceae bacterium]